MVIAVGAQDRFYDKRILDSPEVAIKRMDDYFELLKTAPRTRVVPGPDQCFSNGPDLLKALKKWADDHDTLIHIHSSEEPGTTAWFVKQFGQTPVEYFHSINFLGPRTVLAHQVNCTQHDLEILKETGAKIAHNPLANTILSSGMPPVRQMVEMGIPVAISTDGSGSADNQNMLAAARLTC
jgi:5-methylthioadenosine/S-adenosylhomocysteine deaminase